MNYSIPNHTLVFEDDYTRLSIKENGTEVNSIPLDDPGIIVAVSAESDYYVINTNGDWSDIVHKYDTDGNQTQLEFSGSRLGGIGLVDLRDCGKSGKIEVSYDLSCGAVSIRMLTGPKPFQIFPHDTDCYTSKEV